MENKVPMIDSVSRFMIIMLCVMTIILVLTETLPVKSYIDKLEHDITKEGTINAKDNISGR